MLKRKVTGYFRSYRMGTGFSNNKSTPGIVQTIISIQITLERELSQAPHLVLLTLF